MALNDLNSYKVGGVRVNDLNYSDVELITKFSLQTNNQFLFFSMNGEGISNYNINKSFRSFVDQADFIHADGWSTMIAGRMLTPGKFSVRLATTDCYINILKTIEELDSSVFFLGAKEKTIEKAVRNIRNKFKSLRIAGFHSGYFADEKVIFDLINSSKASVVFVGLGRPKQEEFSIKIKNNCPNVKLVKTCGGLFDFISGKNKRAPVFLQKIGLEWAYRVFNEPRRLFFRYFWTNSYSIYLYLFKSGK